MMKMYLLTSDAVGEETEIAGALSTVRSKKGFVWVDLRHFEKPEIDQLADAFSLHPVEIDSLTEEYTRPHVMEYPDHLHVNFTIVEETEETFLPHEFHAFVGRDFIITAGNQIGGEMIDRVLDRYRDLPALSERGPYYTLYLLSDLLIDKYIHTADDMDDTIDDLEDAMSEHADRKTLQRLFGVKRKLFDLRRYLAPQRDMFNELVMGTFPFIDEHHDVYFQDAYNRMSRVFDVIDTSRDILSGTLDLYQSSISNRLNDIMKVLTILTVILGVFSVITGYFGMNVFDKCPTGSVQFVSFVSVIVGVAVTAGLVYLFKRQGWL